MILNKKNKKMKNQVKQLKEEKSIAYFVVINNGVMFYESFLGKNEDVVKFEIPINDIGKNKFKRQMEAIELIEWIK